MSLNAEASDRWVWTEFWLRDWSAARPTAEPLWVLARNPEDALAFAQAEASRRGLDLEKIEERRLKR